MLLQPEKDKYDSISVVRKCEEALWKTVKQPISSPVTHSLSVPIYCMFPRACHICDDTEQHRFVLCKVHAIPLKKPIIHQNLSHGFIHQLVSVTTNTGSKRTAPPVLVMDMEIYLFLVGQRLIG